MTIVWQSHDNEWGGGDCKAVGGSTFSPLLFCSVFCSPFTGGALPNTAKQRATPYLEIRTVSYAVVINAYSSGTCKPSNLVHGFLASRIPMSLPTLPLSPSSLFPSLSPSLPSLPSPLYLTHDRQHTWMWYSAKLYSSFLCTCTANIKCITTVYGAYRTLLTNPS